MGYKRCGIFLKDQHIEKSNSSNAHSVLNPGGRSSKTSHSHIQSFFRLVNPPNPSSILLKDQHFERSISSNAHRLPNLGGNSSKVSHSCMVSFLRLVSAPNPSDIFHKDRHCEKSNSSMHLGCSIQEETPSKPHILAWYVS